MAQPVFTFDQDSIRKIAAAVRRINGDEGRQPNGVGRGRIQLGGTKIRIGKTDEAIAQFASGTVSIYYPDSAATIPPADETYILDASYDLEAFSLLGDVAISKWCVLVWVGFWLIVNAEC